MAAALTCIAREERDHAELSWAILTFCLARGSDAVRATLCKAGTRLASSARPSAVSAEKLALVSRADPDSLRAHGLVPGGEWATIYEKRLRATELRLSTLLGVSVATEGRARSTALPV